MIQSQPVWGTSFVGGIGGVEVQLPVHISLIINFFASENNISNTGKLIIKFFILFIVGAYSRKKN